MSVSRKYGGFGLGLNIVQVRTEWLGPSTHCIPCCWWLHDLCSTCTCMLQTAHACVLNACLQ